MNVAPQSGLQHKQKPLLPPRLYGGRPLMEALWARRSSREFSELALESRVLSDLLWAGYGINRRDTGERTAPFRRHRMVIDVLVAMESGVWLYEPQTHSLALQDPADIRAQTGTQEFVAALGRVLRLGAEQFVTFTQSVGYPYF